MIERAYVDAAAERRQENDLRAAAGYYVSGAYGNLMTFRTLEEQSERSPTKFGYVCRYRFLGALCYRLGGNEQRTENVCRRGILTARDVRESEPVFRAPESDPPIGLCFEVEGDFRLLGGVGSHDESYREASERYDGVEKQRQWSVEPEFEILVDTLLDLADGVDYHVPDERSERIRDLSLTDRIQFKREEFSEILDADVERGNWAATGR